MIVRESGPAQSLIPLTITDPRAGRHLDAARELIDGRTWLVVD
jgi:hypothetical protein